VASLLEEVKALKKQAGERRPEKGPGLSADELLADAREIAGATVVVQAGGKSPERIPAAMEKAVQTIRERLEP
jgi:hypothetical protein